MFRRLVFNVPLVILCLLHLFLLASLKFTAWPEMLAYPYLLNRGYRLYGDIIHPFMPLLPYILAWVMRFFGESVEVLKVITWVIILVSDVLVFSIAAKLFGTRRALLTLVIFILWQLFFDGNGLWFDLSLVPFLLASFSLLIAWIRKGKRKDAFLLGLFWGLACLIKLSTLWVILVVGVYLFFLRRSKFIRILPVLVAGILLPFGVSFLTLFMNGQASEFLFWGLYYPLVLIMQMPGFRELPTIGNILILGLTLSPLILCLRKGILQGFIPILVVLYTLGGLAFSLHRFAYFHLQPAIPFLAFLPAYIWSLPKGKVVYGLLGVYVTASLFLQIGYVRNNWKKETRFAEAETRKRAEEIQKIVGVGREVFMYNTTGQYFVFAQVLPAKPWVDNFPWYYELPGVQNRVIEALEKDKVPYVLFSPFMTGGKYELGSYTPQYVDQYVHEHFVINANIQNTIWVLQRER